MRLLKTDGLEISLTSSLWDHEIPSYAILSHAWGDSEPTFEDMQTGNAKNLPGWKKIEYAARQALKDGHKHLWVDTVCIDKRDSTELFEAINSMFRWYAEAEVCYVYLVDVHHAQELEHSRWFKRGWTLQEMLAPAYVSFYSASWTHLGSKTDEALRDPILRASGITKSQADVLAVFKADDWTVAERMSWASKRMTTRKEDRAYSLLGLFGVHIPLLYGEGDRAFIRLQQEIMRISDDHSLFAWTDEELLKEAPCGLLARSPAQFAKLVVCDKKHWTHSGAAEDQVYEPHTMTNQGIHINLTLVRTAEPNVYYGMLGYGSSLDRPAIVVKRIRRNEFARIQPGVLLSGEDLPRISGRGRLHRLVFRQRPPIEKSINSKSTPMFWLDYSGLAEHGIFLHRVSPLASWNPHRSLVQDVSPEFIFQYHHPQYDLIRIHLRLRADGSCRLTSEISWLNDVQMANLPVINPSSTTFGPEFWIIFEFFPGISSSSMSVWARITEETEETEETEMQRGKLFSVLISASSDTKSSLGSEGQFVFNVTTALGAYGALHYAILGYKNMYGYFVRNRKSLRLYEIFNWIITHLPIAILPVLWAYIGRRYSFISFRSFRSQAIDIVRALGLRFLEDWVEIEGGEAKAEPKPSNRFRGLRSKPNSTVSARVKP
jgi:hypothetical protein